MKTLRAGIFCALVAAGATTLWVSEHQTQAELLREIDSRQTQGEEIARLKTANESLSNRLSEWKSAQSLSKDQRLELLKLRNEAGRLQKANRAAGAALAAGYAVGDEPAEIPAGQESHPKESWTFTGRGTPEDALESYLWALTRGDLEKLEASYTLEDWKRLTEQFKKDQAQADAPPPDVASALRAEFKNVKGYHILEKNGAEDKVTLQVVLEGEGGATWMEMKKAGGEWKMVVEGDDSGN